MGHGASTKLNELYKLSSGNYVSQRAQVFANHLETLNDETPVHEKY